MSREIDRQVAEKVMGWVRVKGPFGNPALGTIHEYGWKAPDGDIRAEVPAYSDDIAVAWKVLERCRLHVFPVADRWGAAESVDAIDGRRGFRDVRVADTAPQAICLAGLEVAKTWLLAE